MKDKIFTIISIILWIFLFVDIFMIIWDIYPEHNGNILLTLILSWLGKKFLQNILEN